MKKPRSRSRTIRFPVDLDTAIERLAHKGDKPFARVVVTTLRKTLDVPERKLLKVKS